MQQGLSASKPETVPVKTCKEQQNSTMSCYMFEAPRPLSQHFQFLLQQALGSEPLAYPQWS